jgi:hypothetical protein
MKMVLTFKTPDVLDQLPDNDEDADKIREIAKKYVEYGEYLSVEIDSDDGTITVLEVE